MAYQGNLKNGQTIVLENQDDQTIIRVHSSGQSQGSSLTTGQWSAVPLLWQLGERVVIEIRFGEGSSYCTLEGGRLESLNDRPQVEEEHATPIDLKEVADGTGKSEMEPMEPMKPM
ncbi:hypothetical protein [Deinococcus sp.]|uniref:hypothetical protein n=1 Tax=Deinococcus sp. TaxID=47478 RepID=UPI003B5C9791